MNTTTSITEKFPGSWADVTLGQMIDIRNAGEHVRSSQILAILSGLPEQTFLDMDTDEVIPLIASVTAWMNPAPEWAKLERPAVLLFGGKNLEIPEDLNLKAFSQSQQFGMQILDKVHTYDELMAMADLALAIYLQPEWTGQKYSSDDDAKFQKMARECKAVQAFPVAAFFLKRWIPFIGQKMRDSQPSPLSTQMQKEQLALTDSPVTGS